MGWVIKVRETLAIKRNVENLGTGIWDAEYCNI